ncbi:carboxypeptidase-like regulatory domain-containing protein [Parabacteroides sp. FAFU027]|uniref:TonB-dependent receptor n=1 Tax=Parabacteroides sp. FAFU027 TaxID=2922715 RepID=UPI001FAEA6CA|nr:carboxypeptidase-like regulatory domain-containing protein [Parabacteroides sp. FAFU027]
MKKIQLIFLSLLIATTLFSQKKIFISGYVTDAENHSLEKVHVQQWNSPNGITTKENGFYEIAVPDKDTVVLVYSCVGYKKISRTLIKPARRVFLNVKMESSSTELKTLTVTAMRRQMDMMQRIDANKVKFLPDAAGGNIESLIVTFAGVHSNNEMSSQYSVRGGNFDENLVYINGVEVYRPLLVRAGQQEGLSIINPDMVGSVDFSAGGFEARYGDKMSSVLDITYKKPKAFEGAVSASLLGGTAYVGTSSGKFTQMHGIRYKQNRSLLGTLDTKGEYNPSFFDYQTYLTYTFNDKTDVSLLGNISQNKYNFIPQERNTSFGTLSETKRFKVYFDGQEQDLFETGFGTLSLNYHPNKETELKLLTSGFITREKETYDISGQYWLSDVTGDASTGKVADEQTVGVGTYMQHARNRLYARVLSVGHQGIRNWENNRLQWGLNLQSEYFRDKISEWEMRDSAGYSLDHTLHYTGNGASIYYNLNRPDTTVTNHRFSTYLQDTYKLRGDYGVFSVTGGVRASYWSFNNEWIFSPRFSAAWIPAWKKDFTFRAASGIYYQAPFYKEFREIKTDTITGNSRIQLNSNIKSQKSVQLVVGTDYTFTHNGRPYKLTVEGYYKKLSNLIPYVVDNVRVRYAGKNMGDGYATGLDCKLFGEFVPGTDSWVSFSWMKSEENINGVKMPLPTDQTASFTMFFQDYWPTNPKYKLNLKMIWASGLPVTAPQVSDPEHEFVGKYFRTPAYRRVDIGLTRQLVGGEDKWMKKPILRYFKNISLGVDVFNLLDIKNTNSYYWVSVIDKDKSQYAVPNYLTSRQLNVRVMGEF